MLISFLASRTCFEIGLSIMRYLCSSQPLLALELTTTSRYNVQLFSLRQEVYCQACPPPPQLVKFFSQLLPFILRSRLPRTTCGLRRREPATAKPPLVLKRSTLVLTIFLNFCHIFSSVVFIFNTAFLHSCRSCDLPKFGLGKKKSRNSGMNSHCVLYLLSVM